MGKYIIWILLASCVIAHLWMMRKGHHEDSKEDTKSAEEKK